MYENFDGYFIVDNFFELSVTSVPDPNTDPPGPRVFWPSGSTSQRYGSESGSGSGSFYHHAKIIRKNLESYYFVTLFGFLSLKNNVNVPSKSNKQKKLC
jgi:hypothetical protein